MKQAFIYWFFTTIIFLDLAIGGLVFVFSGWYGEYMSLPLNLIEGAGFTYGVSLLPLIPYFALLKFLYNYYKKLDKQKKKLTEILLIVVAALYIFGFISMIGRNVLYEFKEKNGLLEQQISEKQFEKDLIIEDFRVTDIDGWYRWFDIEFDLTIPSKYLGDSEGSITLGLDKNNGIGGLDEIEYTIEYDKSRSEITNIDIKGYRPKENNLNPSFDSNNNLIIHVIYSLNDNEKEDAPSSSIDFDLYVDPKIVANKSYSSNKSNKTFETRRN